MQWVAVYGSKATCCVRATEAEKDAEPERFDCERCELRRRSDALWADNAEAWEIWQFLCSRVVQDLEIRGQALEWVTAGWTAERRVTLLRRLDVILDVIQPPDDGRTSEQRNG